MQQKNKIEKGSAVKTALEIAPLAMQLFDPEITSNPLLVVTKVGQAIAAYFLARFSSEYKTRIDGNELKSGDFFTEKPVLIFTELLKIIDEGKIDAERFRAMKSVFFSCVEKQVGKEQEEVAYLLFQTAKQLSSAEILILSANYQIVKNTGRQLVKGVEWGSNRIVNYWAQSISEKIGHNLPELVLQHENNLMNLKLITDRKYMRNNTEISKDFHSSPYFRLTSFGYKLCELLTKYE